MFGLQKKKDEKSKGFWNLYIGRTVLFVSSGLLGIFLPIFFYELFDENFHYVILFYLLSQLAYGLLVAFGALFFNRFGFKRALVFATLWGSLFYTSLFFLDKGVSAYVLVPMAFLTLLLARMFYWIPYHVDFAKFTDKKNRGKQVSVVLATLTFFGVVGPLVAGIIIDNFGFNALFIIAITTHLIAAVPFSILPRIKEKFSWSYAETWKRLFSPDNRNVALALMAHGAENVVGIVVWPIFIFLLLDGDYFEVGFLSSLIVGGTMVLQFLVGRHLDVMSEKKHMLKLGSVLYSVGWVVKIFVATAFHIFVAGLYHSLTKILTRTPLETMFYELAADQGHYVDEFTVLREMAIQLGKVLSLILISIMALFLAIQWTFVLAAVAALFLNIFYMKKQVDLELR